MSARLSSSFLVPATWEEDGEGIAEATGIPTLQVFTSTKPRLPMRRRTVSDAEEREMEEFATCIWTFKPRTARRERFPIFNMSRSRIAVSKYPPGLRTRLDSEMMFR